MKPPATGSFELIKKINTSRILETLRENGRISRADIARKTGLTPATVSNITAELIELGLIIETVRGESSGGRKPVLLSIHSDVCCFAGVHISPKLIEVAIANVEDEILYHQRRPLRDGIGSAEALSLAVRMVRSAAEHSGAGAIAGIGVCVHGLVQSERGVSLFAPNLGWENVRIGETFQNEFHLPVAVENDVRAMTLAESWCGQAKNVRDYVYLYIGPGIGGSIVIDGELYKGSGGFAGEFGHNTVMPDGPLCACGNRGCLQALASESSVLSSYKKRKGLPPENGITYDDILGLAKKGDPAASEEITKSMKYIGVEVGNIISSFSPTLIVINGHITSLGDFAMEGIEDEARTRILKYSGNSARIVFSQLGDRAQIQGAAAVIIREMFSSPKDFLLR